jgi:hypothetical protein
VKSAKATTRDVAVLLFLNGTVVITVKKNYLKKNVSKDFE